jgi:hypothetical protein
MSATTTKQVTVRVYQLKISLRDITPLIWRRLLVTSDTTIARLHAVLQIAMGWEDLHLHQFRIHGKTYGIYRTGGISFADDPHQVILSDFKLRKGERFVTEPGAPSGERETLPLAWQQRHGVGAFGGHRR